MMSAKGKHVRRALTAGLLVLVAMLVAAPGASALVEQQAPVDVAATAGTPVSGPVATFRSETGNVTAFTATIDWGDGTVTDGVIVALPQDAGFPLPYRV